MVTQIETASERRTDIQALRGIAVLAVMLAHFGSLVPAGFLGVDIFFAISGFVITLSFLKLLKAEHPIRHTLATFWKRRFWRLVPALSVVLTSTLIAALFLLPPDDFRDQFEMAIWSFFFAGNVGVEVISQPDYFDPAADQNWLLHLWSLGVEEQFYLVFPFAFLALMGVWKKTGRMRPVVIWLGAASLVSLLLATWNEAVGWLGLPTSLVETTGLAALFGYYSPLTRAWQFGVGILAALLVTEKRIRRHPALTWAGAVLLLVSFVVVPESNLLPGPITALPMLAMFLLLVSPVPHSIAASKVLAPMTWLGDRSYSAYLWHWPVWSVLTSLTTEGPVTILLAFVLTALLAHATFQFVEQPLIHHAPTPLSTSSIRARKRGPGFAFVRFVLPLPLLLGFVVSGAHWGLEQSGALREGPAVPRIDPKKDCVQTDCSNQEFDLLLVGDSHAGSLANAIFDALEPQGTSAFGAVVARHFGCLHLPSTEVVSVHEECRELSSNVRALVSETKPSVVLIYGYTAGRFTTINSGGEQEISLQFGHTEKQVADAEGPDAYRVALEDTVDFITAQGSSVVIVGGVPDFSLRPEEVGRSGKPASQGELLLAPWLDFEFGQTVSREEFESRHGAFLAIEEDVASRNENVYFVDGWEYLCEQDSCSQIDSSGQFVFSDQDHISDHGATLLAQGVARSLEEWGLLVAR